MNDFIEKLAQLMSDELPGEAAHVEMSPSGRAKSSEYLKYAKTFKESAVAVVLFEENKVYKCLLLQRHEYEGNHSGQVCFPGGKQDEADEDLLATALRECWEETGICSDQLKLIGELTPVFIPVSLHYVMPFVFFHQSKLIVQPDPYEVKDYFSFSLEELLIKSNMKRTEVPISSSKTLPNVPYFHLENKVVWGATAIMLNELKTILLRLKRACL